MGQMTQIVLFQVGHHVVYFSFFSFIFLLMYIFFIGSSMQTPHITGT